MVCSLLPIRLFESISCCPSAEHGQVGVVRNVLERRPSDTLSHLLGREPRLGVTDYSVADLDGVHFGLESNKLDEWRALCLVL